MVDETRREWGWSGGGGQPFLDDFLFAPGGAVQYAVKWSFFFAPSCELDTGGFEIHGMPR